MRTCVLVAVALTCVAVPAAADGPPDVRVHGQRVVSSPTDDGDCPGGPPEDSSAEAEASPALAAGPAGSPVVVWQSGVGHLGGPEVLTHGSALRSATGVLPGAGQCGGGGAGEVVLTPSLATAPDGTVWSASVVQRGGRASVVVSSRPVGGTWSAAEEVDDVPFADSPAGYFPATVAVAPPVPPATAPTVHLAYVRNHFPAGTVAVHRSVVPGGAWSDAHVIGAGPTPFGYDFAEQLVSLGGEVLLAVSTEVDQLGLAGLAPDYVTHRDLTQAPVVHRVRRSTDGGRTWSPPVVALTLANGGVRDRQVPGTALRSLVRPSVAVSSDGGVHVAGESVSRDGRSTQLLLARSRDEGRSWATTAVATVEGLALQTAVAVDGEGRVLVSWLHAPRPDLVSRWEHVVSLDEGGWSSPRAFSRRFDLRALAPAYVGDQGALVGTADGFVAATVVGTGREDDPTDVVLTTFR